MASDDVTTVAPPKPQSGSLSNAVDEILIILQGLMNLPGFSVTVPYDTSLPHQELAAAFASRTMDLMNVLLGAILVEDDIAPMIAYIIFLGQLTESTSFEVSCRE